MKFICHNGAGYDNIDVAACTAKGIQVAHTPKAVNSATADIAMFLMLGALRRIHAPYAALRKKKWRGPALQLGHDPQQKSLGILGMGGIGREVAVRGKAFGMNILYHNRTRLAPDLEVGGATYVGFEELLAKSDVLSLNLSLNAKTKGIIGKKEFAMMKDGVVIVNTARGKLIDEAALVEALGSGKVFSAGLDVYEEEPVIHAGLIDNPNVVLLPHIGTATVETQVSSFLVHNCAFTWKAGQMRRMQTDDSNRKIWNYWSWRICGTQSRREHWSLRFRSRLVDFNPAPCPCNELLI